MSIEQKFLESAFTDIQRLQEQIIGLQNAILSLPLKSLDLEPVVILTLKKADINTIADLVNKTEKQLEISIGAIQVKIIKIWLKKYGLQFL